MLRRLFLSLLFISLMVLTGSGQARADFQDWGNIEKIDKDQLYVKCQNRSGRVIKYISLSVPAGIPLSGIKVMEELKAGDFITFEYLLNEADQKAVASQVTFPKGVITPRILPKPAEGPGAVVQGAVASDQTSRELARLWNEVDKIKAEIEALKKK